MPTKIIFVCVLSFQIDSIHIELYIHLRQCRQFTQEYPTEQQWTEKITTLLRALTLFIV